MIDDSAEKLTQRYNREAQDYQRLWAPVLHPAGLRLLDELADPKPNRILDVATGVGVLLPDLRRMFGSAFIAAVDRSPGMLGLAPAVFPRAMMDASQLAIASASMDLVIMAFMLFHLDKPLDGLLEARRVLRIGGRVGTLTWAGEMESLAHGIWKELMDAYGAPPPETDVQARHAVVDAPEKLDALFRDAGFTTTRAWFGDLTTTFTLETFLERCTRMGAGRARLSGLNAAMQTECVAEARRRLAALPPKGFEARGKIVYGVAVV
jgi:SAM-dependent methyltransferase